MHMAIFGNMIGSTGGILGKTVEIISDDGVDLMGVVVDQEQILDAVASKDIREGKTAVTNEGLVIGSKRIPAYDTTQSTFLVRPGQNFSIPLSGYDKYDYTKFQCMIAKYDSNPLLRMSIDRIVMNDNVYAVNSSEIVSNVTKNSNTKSIDLNITNNTEDIYIIYYFTYKESDNNE